MIGEIWTYVATKPNDGTLKVRPVLIVGDDSDNLLKYVDIHYVIISSSALCGKYDIELSEEIALKIGLKGKSVIKTTKLYTGTKSKLGSKISELPDDIRKEFIEKYKSYQTNLINKMELVDCN